MSLKWLAQIEKSSTSGEMSALVRESVCEGPSVSLKFLRKKNWVVGPVAGQPERVVCEKIVSVARKEAVERFFLVLIERIDEVEFWEVPIDGADLDFALGAEHRSLSNLILYCAPLKFLIFKDATDFYLICGPKSEVEEILESKIEIAWEVFEKEANARVGDSRYVDLRPTIKSYRDA